MPDLAPRFRVRRLEPRDRRPVTRLIAHAFQYHNSLNNVYQLPATTYIPTAELVFDHCLPQSLSFVIDDTDTDTDADKRESDSESDGVWDHDRHAHSLKLSRAIVGAVLCYDESQQMDWPSLIALHQWCPEQMTLWRTLGDSPQCDVRPEGEKGRKDEPYAQGQQVEVFFLAGHCQYQGRGLSRALCEAVYDEARRLGYQSVGVSASHPVTAHIFLSSPFNGVITHRITNASVPYTHSDGTVSHKFAEPAGAETMKIKCYIARKWSLRVIKNDVSVIKLSSAQPLPASLLSSATKSCQFLSLTVAGNERSLIIDTQAIPPELQQSLTLSTSYRALGIDQSLDSELVGVLAELLVPLQQARISVLTVSTFDTDYVLVPVDRVTAAIESLRSKGHTVTEHH